MTDTLPLQRLRLLHRAGKNWKKPTDFYRDPEIFSVATTLKLHYDNALAE